MSIKGYEYYCAYCKNNGTKEKCDKCEIVGDSIGIRCPSEYERISELDSKNESDPVSRPIHYQTKSGLEAIQVIEAFTEDLVGAEAVYTGNVLKYMLRWKKKNGLEDLKKAKQYLDWLINYVEKEEKENE